MRPQGIADNITPCLLTLLSSANVSRAIIQDDNDALQYSSTPPLSWVPYPIGLQHPRSNISYRQINPVVSGSITFPFLGDAIFVYGPGWSFHPSTYRVSVDNQAPTTLYLNSTLPGNSTGRSSFFDSLLFSQFNLTGPSHTLTIDNDNGMAQFALDYIEIVYVTPQDDPLPIVPIVVVPLIVVGIVAVMFLWRRRKNRSRINGTDGTKTATGVVSHVDMRNGTLINISGDQHNYYTNGSIPGEGYSAGGNSG